MQYFTISELTRSQTAKALHIDNFPTPEAVDNMEVLINECLDHIRELWGKPIYVTSGYRCPELNKAVKGKATSQHLKGEAADITTGNIDDNKKLFNLIVGNINGIVYDQLIDESGYQWLHISYKAERNRMQILHLK